MRPLLWRCSRAIASANDLRFHRVARSLHLGNDRTAPLTSRASGGERHCRHANAARFPLTNTRLPQSTPDQDGGVAPEGVDEAKGTPGRKSARAGEASNGVSGDGEWTMPPNVTVRRNRRHAKNKGQTARGLGPARGTRAEGKYSTLDSMDSIGPWDRSAESLPPVLSGGDDDDDDDDDDDAIVQDGDEAKSEDHHIDEHHHEIDGAAADAGVPADASASHGQGETPEQRSSPLLALPPLPTSRLPSMSLTTLGTESTKDSMELIKIQNNPASNELERFRKLMRGSRVVLGWSFQLGEAKGKLAKVIDLREASGDYWCKVKLEDSGKILEVRFGDLTPMSPRVVRLPSKRMSLVPATVRPSHGRFTFASTPPDGTPGRKPRGKLFRPGLPAHGSFGDDDADDDTLPQQYSIRDDPADATTPPMRASGRALAAAGRDFATEPGDASATASGPKGLAGRRLRRLLIPSPGHTPYPIRDGGTAAGDAAGEPSHQVHQQQQEPVPWLGPHAEKRPTEEHNTAAGQVQTEVGSAASTARVDTGPDGGSPDRKAAVTTTTNTAQAAPQTIRLPDEARARAKELFAGWDYNGDGHVDVGLLPIELRDTVFADLASRSDDKDLATARDDATTNGTQQRARRIPLPAFLDAIEDAYRHVAEDDGTPRARALLSSALDAMQSALPLSLAQHGDATYAFACLDQDATNYIALEDLNDDVDTKGRIRAQLVSMRDAQSQDSGHTGGAVGADYTHEDFTDALCALKRDLGEPNYSAHMRRMLHALPLSPDEREHASVLHRAAGAEKDATLLERCAEAFVDRRRLGPGLRLETDAPADGSSGPRTAQLEDMEDFLLALKREHGRGCLDDFVSFVKTKLPARALRQALLEQISSELGTGEDEHAEADQHHPAGSSSGGVGDVSADPNAERRRFLAEQRNAVEVAKQRLAHERVNVAARARAVALQESLVEKSQQVNRELEAKRHAAMQRVLTEADRVRAAREAVAAEQAQLARDRQQLQAQAQLVEEREGAARREAERAQSERLELEKQRQAMLLAQAERNIQAGSEPTGRGDATGKTTEVESLDPSARSRSDTKGSDDRLSEYLHDDTVEPNPNPNPNSGSKHHTADDPDTSGEPFRDATEASRRRDKTTTKDGEMLPTNGPSSTHPHLRVDGSTFVRLVRYRPVVNTAIGSGGGGDSKSGDATPPRVATFDVPPQAVAALATGASRVHLTCPDDPNLSATSKAHSYPIKRLAAGRSLSAVAPGRPAGLREIIAAWEGSPSALEALVCRPTPGTESDCDRALNTCLYHAVGNPAGLRAFTDGRGPSGWGVDRAQPLDVYVDVSSASLDAAAKGGLVGSDGDGTATADSEVDTKVQAPAQHAGAGISGDGDHNIDKGSSSDAHFDPLKLAIVQGVGAPRQAALNALRVSGWNIQEALELLDEEGLITLPGGAGSALTTGGMEIDASRYPPPPKPRPAQPRDRVAPEASRPQLTRLLRKFQRNAARVHTRSEYMQLKALEVMGKIEYLSFAEFNSHLERAKRHARAHATPGLWRAQHTATHRLVREFLARFRERRAELRQYRRQTVGAAVLASDMRRAIDMAMERRASVSDPNALERLRAAARAEAKANLHPDNLPTNARSVLSLLRVLLKASRQRKERLELIKKTYMLPLRFEPGDTVRVYVFEYKSWEPGVVSDVWVQGYPYRVRLKSSPIEIFVYDDTNDDIVASGKTRRNLLRQRSRELKAGNDDDQDVIDVVDSSGGLTPDRPVRKVQGRVRGASARGQHRDGAAAGDRGFVGAEDERDVVEEDYDDDDMGDMELPDDAPSDPGRREDGPSAVEGSGHSMSQISTDFVERLSSGGGSGGGAGHTIQV